MTRTQRISSAAGLLLVVGTVSACSDTRSERSTGSTDGSAGAVAAVHEAPELLATIAGEDLRYADLAGEARDRLAQMETAYRQQHHALLVEAVNGAIAERLLTTEAEARGITVAALIAEDTQPITDPSDAAVEAWYNANQSRLQGRSLDQLREQIRQFLREAQGAEQAAALDTRLRDKYGVTIHLDPFRIAFDNAGSPSFGTDDAPVTLVEFSDFECPFCGRFAPTLGQVKRDYGDRVRVVYRQFPIPSLHPAAFKASEASLCAHEQGEFWSYHDLLFEEQDRLTVRDLKEKAGRLGLDQDDFNRCLDSGRYVEQVQDDQSAGRAAGISGTPALFVNGIPIEGGAVAYDSVASALDAELARVGG